MLPLILTILIGLIGGFAVGIQGPIAGAMGQRVGGLGSSFIVHLGGMLLSGVLFFIQGATRFRDLLGLPWYMLGCGVLGVILFSTISYTLPRIGGAAMIALLIVGQLLVGLLVDQYGWFGVALRPVSLGRIAGLLLLLAGGYLISR
jgi:bacterial/archaeal transporter family-2 protein